MLKKLLDGFVFGIGFAIAFVIIWAIAASLITAKMRTSLATHQPPFHHPKQAQIADVPPAGATGNRGFSFFKHTELEQEKVPVGGGILSISTVTTPGGAKRPSTYQLWLTDSKLWQIRTIEEKVETEQLVYPADATMTGLDSLMLKNLGFQAAQESTMPVSGEELRQLKTGDDSWRNASMNGKLRITADGIVFVEPNPY